MRDPGSPIESLDAIVAEGRHWAEPANQVTPASITPVKDGDCRSVKPHKGRWLAGFAPVGNTGFVAIVETLRDDAAHPNETLVIRLLLWGGLPFAFCAALLALAVRYARRRLERTAP